MGRLIKEEIRQVQNALEQSGLTYAQLQEELLDHLICDIEIHMQQGLSFQQAWQKVIATIPKNQLKNIQTETMEIMNKKISATKIMILLSFFLLFSATVFKLLHLQGTNMLLLSAFVMGGLTVLAGSLKGYYSSKNKGGGLILILGLFIVIFITSLVFQVLNWPGGRQLRFVSVIPLTLLFPAVSVYFFRKKQAAQNHPLVLLTTQNQSIIENVVVALVGLGVIFKIPVLLQTSPHNFAPTLFLVLGIFIAGLFMFSITWKAYVATLSKKAEKALIFLLLSSIGAFFLFMLPAINWGFPEIFKTALPVGFYVLLAATVMVYYLVYSQDIQSKLLAFFSFLLLLVPLLRFFIDLGILDNTFSQSVSDGLYNWVVLSGIILLLAVFYKKTIFKAFMLLMLAHYVYTYPVL